MKAERTMKTDAADVVPHEPNTDPMGQCSVMAPRTHGPSDAYAEQIVSEIC